MKTYWLSFCDEERPHGQRFLGVAVIDVTDDDFANASAADDVRTARDPWLAAALVKAWSTGCNPGGQTLYVELPVNSPRMTNVPRHKLLSKIQLKDLGLIPE